jgi:ribose 5-phosphate isomerase B
LCGSGIGISIAVNREPACRCALVSEPLSASLARQHNDANVIAIGAREHTLDEATGFVETFLATPFSGNPRHARRIAQLAEYEANRPALPELPAS